VSTSAELTHLFCQLKAPAAARALPKLAEWARAEEWSYERFAEALLATEQSSCEAHGGESRIRAARFPARKTLEEFDFSFQRSVRKQVIEHLAPLDFLHPARTWFCSARRAPAGHTSRSRSRSAPASPANVPSSAPRPSGSLCSRTPSARAASTRSCVGSSATHYSSATKGLHTFDPQAANLVFMLVSRRYERTSLIVTSNKPFSAWGEIFGDDATAAAMIDRLVHHAELISLKGNSYRLKDHDLGARPTPQGAETA
jgi:hypothetical protein